MLLQAKNSARCGALTDTISTQPEVRRPSFRECRVIRLGVCFFLNFLAPDYNTWQFGNP